MKRFLIGALKLVGLFIIASIVAVMSPQVGQIVGIVAVVVGGIAVIKPLPRIGLGHRGFAFLVALLIGPLGFMDLMSLKEARIETEAEVEVAERRAQAEEATRAVEAARAENERLARATMAAQEATETRAEPAPPPEPVHVQFRRWETHCEPQCRTFTLADFRVFSGSPPTKLVLEIDPNRKVLVSALDTEAQHRKFYTNRAPIELRRGSVNYVPARSFFNDRFAADLTIGGSKVARLSTYDESHLGGELTDGLLARLRAGSRAELVFVSLMRGKGQRVTFSLLGFTKAYGVRTDSPEAQASSSAAPRSIIAASLKGNKFGLRPDGLQERPNPRGEGVFVFFPEMEIAGYKRLFVWFVHGDQAVALNGPSKTATPSLPFPRDVSFRFWTGTGVSVDDATNVGLTVVFK